MSESRLYTKQLSDTVAEIGAVSAVNLHVLLVVLLNWGRVQEVQKLHFLSNVGNSLRCGDPHYEELIPDFSQGRKDYRHKQNLGQFN